MLWILDNFSCDKNVFNFYISIFKNICRILEMPFYQRECCMFGQNCFLPAFHSTNIRESECKWIITSGSQAHLNGVGKHLLFYFYVMLAELIWTKYSPLPEYAHTPPYLFWACSVGLWLNSVCSPSPLRGKYDKLSVRSWQTAGHWRKRLSCHPEEGHPLHHFAAPECPAPLNEALF